MMRRTMAVAIVVLAAVVLSGCSSSSGINVFKNLSREDTNLRVYLDGQQAEQSTLEKGLKGYSPFKIKEPVSTSPVFKYEIIEPKKFGDIMSVHLQVHQKFEADFSDIADYVIHTTDANNRAEQMKPGVEYELGDLGPKFTILNKNNQRVNKVEFVPGQEYLLVFTIRADQSESIQIYFKTK